MKMTHTHDIKFMKAALALARKGARTVFTNPMVGCVIVKDGRVIGRGYHKYFGGKHAEINAIEDAGRDTCGSTMYVNLEPCSHWGKTPPCSDAIIAAGVRRVVIAISDPNPKVNYSGIKKLRQCGIEIVVGVLKDEARKLNKNYLKNTEIRKSSVTVKFAMTLDGKIAAKSGDSKWISSNSSRSLVHQTRARVDGVLVGINTILKDDPWLSAHGKGRNPAKIVIDPSLKIPLSSRVLKGYAPVIIFASSNVNPLKVKKLSRIGVLVERVLTINGQINFKDIINKLSKMSIYDVFIEGGGNTIALALNSGVVDKLMAFIAPKIVGGKDALSPVEGPGLDRISRSIMLTKMSSEWIENDLLVTADIKKQIV